ncbi:MAG: YraN family protein [Thermoanaerobaculia bacterium]|nr:YraN family protein [Thermoanaerobaculia bacterium]
MGDAGESDAERYLEAQGYRTVQRNFSCRDGEIDRIAWEGETLCFVEIKARVGRRFGSAVESISRAKRRRLVKAAHWYLAQHPTDAPCRFDVLAMDMDDSGEWRFTLLRSAFDAA